MKRTARSKKWPRALAAAGLILTLRAAAPARAGDAGAVSEETDQNLSLPPTGTHRLIRIGPQALIIEDDRGRVTMADEPTAEPSRGRGLMGVLFGVLLAGAAVTLGRNELTGEAGGRADSR